MFSHLPYTNLTQTITWIWAGFLVAGLAAWRTYRYWRKRRPPAPRAPVLSYSQRLKQRLTKSQGATKRKQRGNSTNSRPRRL